MPSGHPNDPEAFRAKMTAAREVRATKKQAEIDEVRKLSVAGYSYADISSQMNIAESSVRSMLAPAPVRKHITKKRSLSHSMENVPTIKQLEGKLKAAMLNIEVLEEKLEESYANNKDLFDQLSSAKEAGKELQNHLFTVLYLVANQA